MHHEKIERATRAAAFMANPLFDEMFFSVREAILSDWQQAAGKVDGVEYREQCANLIYVLDKLKEVMTRQVQSGKVAQHDLQQIKRIA